MPIYIRSGSYRSAVILAVTLLLAPVMTPIVHGAGGGGEGKERTSRISDEAVAKIDIETFPKRPKPIFELGNPFLSSGNIARGVELPGGAVWQPSFLVYGTYRTAFQVFHNGNDTFSEWANRLDLFGNLALSGTERILAGIRPLSEDGRFTSYRFRPSDENGFEDEFNVALTTLFFEGDFGEIFPNADINDTKSNDLGFSVGRQPLFYQEGMLINDTIDAIGITRNTLLPRGGSDLQYTFLYGWNEITRRQRDDNNRNVEESDLHLLGLFVAGDYPKNTWNADFVYVIDENETNGGFWGVSTVQRIGHYNTSFRVLGSHALNGETASMTSGYLMFAEISWTPPWTHDNVYVDVFLGIDDFSSVSRDTTAGGPLGRTGILFAAVGIGRYGAALGNQADETAGAAVGYQAFLDDDARKQIIFELGGRSSTDRSNQGALGVGSRYQQAIGQHTVLQLDAFGTLQEAREGGYGGRVELRFEF